MSVCEHMTEESSVSGDQSPEEKLLNIQNELLWGLTYRNYKENEKHKPILPMHSPINIPFELCRAEMLLGRKNPAKVNYPKVDISQEEGDCTERSKGAKKRKISREKPTLLERNVWSQDKYMEFLSLPNPKFYEEPKKKKYKKRCELEPCSPRFIQLAVPNKRRVFANWKEYAGFLPAEMLMRYEEILHTDQNLEPRAARYYYKKLDRDKRSRLKKKRRSAEKKKSEKAKDSQWLQSQIDSLATAILDYIQDEPLFTLNYKQMLLSDGILDRLESTKMLKKPSRKTKNHCKKTIIDVSDKFAIWIDTLTRFVDVQAVESDKDIPPLSISSLSEEGDEEGEDESDYDYSSEDELRDDQFFKPIEEDTWGEDGDETDELHGEDVEAIMEDIFRPGEGEGEAELDNMLNELDGDILDRLIRILSNCSDDFLDREIDSEKMPGVKYKDVLDRLKALRDGLFNAESEKPFLEQIMIDWAIQNDPDNVNDEILQKIHEVAGLLGDWMTKPPARDEEGQAKPPGKKQADFLATDDDENVTDAEGGYEAAVKEGDEGEEAADEIAEGEARPEEVATEEDETPDGGEAAEEGEPAEGSEDKIREGEEKLDEVTGEEEKIGGENEAATPSTSTALDEGEEAGVSQGTLMDEYEIAQTDGEATPLDEAVFSDLEEVEDAGLVLVLDEEREWTEGKEEIAVLFEPTEKITPEKLTSGLKLEGRIIKGHSPSKTFEHYPDTVCCLSLKTWAVWLLEITHNAHNWTQWMSCLIQKVREYASIVRGDVKQANGQVKILRKAEWRKFIKETEESVVAWRQYSSHVKDLSQSIIENFHDKKVNCCPKCLQDHLITNVVVAHDTLQALTEAISCAAYWQRCLDNLVDKTCSLAHTTKGDDMSSEESCIDADLEEIDEYKSEESGESVYEIEGYDAIPKENVVES